MIGIYLSSLLREHLSQIGFWFLLCDDLVNITYLTCTFSALLKLYEKYLTSKTFYNQVKELFVREHFYVSHKNHLCSRI